MKERTNNISRREVSALVKKSLIDQLSKKGIKDKRVLDALFEIPRDRFTEEEFIHLAYKDQALPIGYEQTISQPYVVAYMTQALLAGRNVKSVLEIGTGSGYQAAILANLVPRVFTIERIDALYRKSKQLLKELGYYNINFRCADGCKGWKEFAPYDAIIVTAANQEVPSILLDQLVVGGKMAIPLEDVNGNQKMTILTRKEEGYAERTLGLVKFVPLIKEQA